MAIETENPFEADVTGLDVIGVKPGAFDRALQLEQQEKLAKLTTPTIEQEVPKIEVDVPTQAQISVKRDPLELQTFDLLNPVKEDAKSEVGQLGFDVSLRQKADIPDFKTTLADYQKDLTKKPSIESIGVSGKKTAEEVAKDEIKGEIPYFAEPNLDPLQQKGEQYARDAYQKYFGTPTPTGGWHGTGYGSLSPEAQAAPPPTKPTSFTGTGYGALAPTTVGPQGFAGAGYGALKLPGTSIAAAAQAGKAAAIRGGFSGTGYGGLSGTGTSGGVSSASAGMTFASQLASVYSIYKGVKEGGQGYVDAAMAASVLATGGATAIPVAIITGLKALFGMRRRGRPKFPFGGTEFKTEGNKLKFKHPYGYNGFNGGVARAGAASVADYVNTFVSHFSDYTGQGLQFNSKAYAKAIQDDPRLNRYDTMNDSGYADPSVLIRKLFETPGIITGTPYKNGVPITGQEQYTQAMIEFNDWYGKTAKERGGLVNAQWLNTEEEPNMFGENWAGQYGEVPDQIHHRTRGEFLYDRGGGGFGQTPDPVYRWHESYEDVKSPYDTLYYNITGKFNRGDGGMGY